MIAIPNMDKPETCDMCPIEGCEYINVKFTCPLIDIVWCGECIWHKEYDNGCWCRRHCNEREKTDFCSDGVRRTDDD